MARDRETNTIWILVDNQAAIRRSLSPATTAGQHLAIRIINNLNDILQARPNIKVNIQWVPGHTKVAGNEIVDKCAKDVTGLPGRCPDSFTSLTSIDKSRKRALESGSRCGQPQPKDRNTVTWPKDRETGDQAGNQRNSSPAQTRQPLPQSTSYG